MPSIVAGVKEYVQAMMDRISGMKVLILDSETTGIISMIFSHSDIMEHEVFLTERLGTQQQERMRCMNAICLVRPTSRNFDLLTEELKAPKYKEYHIFFTNVIPKERLEQLACCDEHGVVQQVQEFFADFYALSHDLFSLNLPSTIRLTEEDPSHWTFNDWGNFNRTVEGLLAACLTLRMLPAIRYTEKSKLTKQVAQQLQARIREEQSFFDTMNRNGEATPLLLLLDRRNDPVTPLLTQWTYQAMIHELLTLDNYRIDPSNVPGKTELQEIVMSTSRDQFFEENVMTNWGDLGPSIEKYVEDYKQQRENIARIESIEDVQRFSDEYPELKKMSENVSKHVSVGHALKEVIDAHCLRGASQLEQEIACSESRQEHFQSVVEMINGTSITNPQRLRLVLLYALRYERDSSVDQLKELLRNQGVDDEQVRLVDQLLRYAGSHARSGDHLFKNQTLMANFKSKASSTLKNVDNIYMQHKTYLAGVVDKLKQGKLKESKYPFIEGCQCASPASEQMQRTLVFVVGGATFEEARDIAELNRSLDNGRGGHTIVLGGTTIHNSRSFLDDVANLP